MEGLSKGCSIISIEFSSSILDDTKRIHFIKVSHKSNEQNVQIIYGQTTKTSVYDTSKGHKEIGVVHCVPEVNKPPHQEHN